MLVGAVEDFVENALYFFDELNQIVGQLPLVLVDVGNGLVLYQPYVVLDLGHQTAPEHTLLSQQLLQDAISAHQVPENFSVQSSIVLILGGLCAKVPNWRYDFGTVLELAVNTKMELLYVYVN